MEEAVQFPSARAHLFGILHAPEAPMRGEVILMVVGGPQTRAGCHRAYVDLARRLCAAGHTVLRFDYEGIGDSEGSFVGYEQAAPSVRAAMDFLTARFAGRRIVLWSLCDGSAACLAYAPHDAARIGGLILCNPYVHTEQGRARTFLRHYYLRKVFDPSFLKRLFTFQINPFRACASLLGMLVSALASRKAAPAASAPAASAPAAPVAAPSSIVRPPAGSAPKFPDGFDGEGCFREESVREVVVDGLDRYRGPVRVLLSENDFTAREFETLAQGDSVLGPSLRAGRIALLPVAEADHTFSLAAYRARAAELTLQALREFAPAGAV